MADTRSLPVLDIAAMASLRELDPTGKNQLLERVLGAFRASTERLLPQLQTALTQANTEGMRYVAHTLKSSAASVGGMKVSAMCAALEFRIRSGDFSDLARQVSELDDEAKRLLQAIVEYGNRAEP